MNVGINGVPADQWGTWCLHGKRIVEPNPAQPLDCFNTGRVVDPWPCTECTYEQFAQDMADEQAAYEAERWAEYRALTA
ncbi:MAG: hypothetical protein ABW022_14815 [Actinoplanes sp.]